VFGLLKVVGKIKALSPVFHGGDEKTGSVVLLRRERFIVDGEPMDIPVISGNAVRGVWRRYAFVDFLSLLDYTLDVSTKQGRKLYHTLFTGGILEGVDTGAEIDVELKKEVFEYVIPARLFGFSFGNQMIEGKLKVGKLLPICEELNDYLPVKSDRSVYTMIGKSFQTRKDDIRERDEDEQAVQMLVEYEVFIPGTEFYHKVMVEDPEPIDVSCLERVIELWKLKPFVGGKSSIGMGELEINYDLDATSEEYVKFVEEKRDEICSVLEELKKRL